MALQLILGSSGSGKSSYLYEKIQDRSKQEPDTCFFIVVPEQFTMQTQRELVKRQENHGIMNIDVVSFQRLAYRIFDELGLKGMKVLEETGKNFVLRRVAAEKYDQLRVLKGNMKKSGYINEVKSVISELKQYRIDALRLAEFLQDDTQPALFRYRLADIQTIYEGFLEYLKGSYVTAEEVLEVLAQEASASALLKNCVMVLDGFTGFTPVQYHLLEQLMGCVKDIYVTVTIDKREHLTSIPMMHELFYMSKKTIQTLTRMAADQGMEIQAPSWVHEQAGGRFKDAPQLQWLEQNLFRKVPRSYPGTVIDIQMNRLINPRQELTFIAVEIKRLVREEGYRFRDIAVVCGDVAMYANYVVEVFSNYQIPVFLDQKNKITFHPLTEMIRNMLRMLEQDFSYESVFSYLRCGMNGMLEEVIDLLENYVLANRIRSLRVWQKKWVRRKGVVTEEELELVNEARQTIITQLEPALSVFQNKETNVHNKATALYHFLTALDIQNLLVQQGQKLEAAGKLSLAREYEQIYKIVMDLLDKLVQLLPGEQMNLREFRELLEAGFEAAAVGIIPPGYDQVLVGDIERTRLANTKILFLAGANDGLIPKAVEKGGLLSQQERELLAAKDMGLSPTAREKSFIQKFYLYLNLTKPSQKLYVTWFLMNGSGKETRPSYLIAYLKKLFPGLEEGKIGEQEELFNIVTANGSRRFFVEGLKKAGKGEVSPVFRALYQWYQCQEEWQKKVDTLLDAAFLTFVRPPLGKEVTRALYGAVLENSVTRLERFSACAFAHFMAYGLGLKERQLGEFAPVDMGNIFHEALERYSVKMEEAGYHWFDVPVLVKEKLTEEAVTDTVAAMADTVLSDGARTAYTLERIRRILKRTIDTIQSQISESSFSPEGYEVSFSFAQDAEAMNFTLSDEEKMRLKGRIDRVDTKQKEDGLYVKVVDYKTGNTQFQLISLYHGLQLQLVVYLNAAVEILKRKYKDVTIKPAGMYYYHIDDPVIDVKGATPEEAIRDKVLEQLKLNGVGLDNLDDSVSKKSQVAEESELRLLSDYVTHKIQHIGTEIYKGSVDVNPYLLKEKTGCDYCTYHGICGFDTKLPGADYHRLADLKDKERILAKMREEV